MLELLDRYCEGQLKADEKNRLEAMLRDDPKACLIAAMYLDQHAQMQWLARGTQTGSELVSQALEMELEDDVRLPDQVIEQQLELKEKLINVESARMRAMVEKQLSNQVSIEDSTDDHCDDEQEQKGILYSFAGINIYRGQRTSYGLKIQQSHLAAAMILLALGMAWLWYSQSHTPKFHQAIR